MNRCVRNNNPLNIVKGSSWKGLKAIQTDSRFCQFDTPEFGFRAAWYLLRKYIKRGWNTPRLIISHWCPDVTKEDYISYVCSEAYVDPDQILEFGNNFYCRLLLFYMARYEGWNVDDSNKLFCRLHSSYNML